MILNKNMKQKKPINNKFIWMLSQFERSTVFKEYASNALFMYLYLLMYVCVRKIFQYVYTGFTVTHFTYLRLF